MEQLITPGTEQKLASTPGLKIVKKRRMAAISVDDLAGASSTDKKISKMAPLAVNIKKLEKEELRQKSCLDRETYLTWQARLYEISSLPWSSLENISPRGVLLTLNCLSVKYSFHFSYLPEINLKCQKNYF